MRILLAVALLGLGAAGADFDERQRRDAEAGLGDVTLRLRTEKTRYRMGERIAVLMDFSCARAGKYRMSTEEQDRSGRVGYDEVVVERADAVDPYTDLYHTGVIGWILGGPGSSAEVGPRVTTVTMILNDRVRFDGTGVYRLYVKSRRISGAMAVSGILAVEILPEFAALSEDPDGWRYLGTAEAVRRELAEAEPDARLLAGARDRKGMLVEFDRYLGDPRVVLTSWMIRVRALFRYVEERRPRPLPMFGWAFPVGVPFEVLQAEADRRLVDYQGYVRREAGRWMKAGRKVEPGVVDLAPEAAVLAGLMPVSEYVAPWVERAVGWLAGLGGK